MPKPHCLSLFVVIAGNPSIQWPWLKHNLFQLEFANSPRLVTAGVQSPLSSPTYFTGGIPSKVGIPLLVT